MAPSRALYGVTISDTIKRGNPAELKALLKEAKATHKAQGDLAKHIGKIEVAIKKPKPGIHVMYGVPIKDAIKRGNPAELKGLLAQAKAARKDQGDLAAAIKNLEAAIKAK
jgi:uncharacterized protein DUF1843